MANEKETNLKEANLKASIELEIINKEAERKKKEFENQQKLKDALQKEKTAEALSKKKQKTGQLIADIDEAKKHASRYPLQQHNVASLIMEMEPRFANLGKFFTSLQMQAFQEYIAPVVSSGAHGLYTATAHSLSFPTGFRTFREWQGHRIQKATFNKLQNQKVDIPDLQYLVKVDENGEFTAEFVPAFIKDFIIKRDKNGDAVLNEKGETIQDPEKAVMFQMAFQESVEKWLNTLDIEIDGVKGYFVHKEGDKFRIYPKAFSKDVDGVLTLNEEKVLDRYEASECEYNLALRTYIPKPNARLKSGKDPLYMQPEEFNRLRENLARPEQSLGNFLEHDLGGLPLEPSSSMSMRI